MSSAFGDTGHAGPSRQRSHHKIRPHAYCHCAKCGGNIKQNAVVIKDHQTRYPRAPTPVAVEGDQLGAAMRQMNYDNEDYPNRLVNEHEEPMRSPSPQHVYSLPGSPPEMPIDGQHDLQADFDAPGEDMEVDREYPFDNLLGDLDDRPNLRFIDYVGAEIEEELEEDRHDDAWFDEDFGIPEGANDLEPQAQRFDFRVGEEFEELIQPGDIDPDDEGNNAGAEHRAFQEHALIRNAYIDAYVQKVIYGATHRALKHQLKSARRTIAANPVVPREDIAGMAQTIKTAETRLGVNTDQIITTFTLCPLCKRRYSPEYIATTDEETCLNDWCEGVLFTVRNLASGARRRVSKLTYPFASPIAWLKHMLRLPGISELMQTWRDDERNDGELGGPIPSEEWMQNLDLNTPIADISDGWGWRSTSAGLERRYDQHTGNVIDESILDPPIRFVSLPYGISLSLNTDWFQATKEGSYSVGACYLAINNLPRHLRFLRENVALCIIMPGPNEPNHYALDQMLEPLIDELLELKQGVQMSVRRGDPPVYEEKIVHGELSQHLADLMARIKMGGGAGLKSELNFCLYCHSRLSSLSVPAGYIRDSFRFRDPQQELRNAYEWRSLPSHEERKRLFDATGNRFTALHNIPGWYTASSSPPDAMHLLYLGATNWIVKQVLVAPGIFNKRRAGPHDPQAAFNACLESMWVPKNFQRLPPKLGQTQGSVKADQWKLTSRILYVPLYMALRDGDAIPPVFAPPGNRNSTSVKHCALRAKNLHQQRQKHYRATGQPDLCPPLEECYSSRSLQFHYRQVLRFCLAVNIIDKRSITPAEVAFAQELLELLAKDYLTNNVPLPPNFHYMMHLEEFLLKCGSVYNTHVWGMERANRIVSQINHNGKSGGILEGTFMRGWWDYSAIQNLINILRSLPDRTEADESVIEDLLVALQGGVEQAQQQGTLLAFIAQCQTAYTQLYGMHESIRLSKQSRVIDLERFDLYELVLRFCIDLWPDAGIFGPGVAQNIYLAPVGMVRNHSYVEHNGIRYGSYHHTNGKGYCFGYINERYPVRVERILHIEFPGQVHMRSVCAVVRLFQPPRVRVQFPWDTWAGHLGASSWEYGQLGEPVVVSATQFSGVFALFDIPMSYGRYWVTVALDS
ncbi:Transposase family tnp2 [Ceratobasidium sp. AG-Ba]|nr:Transposase family tnp2 [Ceratobasidium sp. AG-Ba]